MKKAALLIFVLGFVSALLFAQNEEETKSEVRLGSSSTNKPIAGFTVLTAEDTKVTTDGKTTYIEDVYTYTGRKFKAIEARLNKIETVLDELKGRVKYIEEQQAKAKNEELPQEKQIPR
ncbi:MAG: hypothetical protein Q7S30_06110 [Candidatus Omnitrophota bacterium]|nr:hypothetical protein [Candidatus Omnitrophota bacterium]